MAVLIRILMKMKLCKIPRHLEINVTPTMINEREGQGHSQSQNNLRAEKDSKHINS